MRASEGSTYSAIKRTEPFGPANSGLLVDWAYGEMMAYPAHVLELKANSIATHKDRYQITEEFFMSTAKEMELGVVKGAQELLSQEVSGPAPGSIFYKAKLAPVEAKAVSGGGGSGKSKGGKKKWLCI